MRFAFLEFNRDPILKFVSQFLKLKGHDIRHIDFKERPWGDIEKDLSAYDPHILLTNNFYIFDLYHDGATAEERLQSLKWPLISWYFESPSLSGSTKLNERWRSGPWNKNILYLIADPGYRDFFSERQLETEVLPLGCDPALLQTVIDDKEKASLRCPISFAGTPFEGISHYQGFNEEFFRRGFITSYAYDLFRLAASFYPQTAMNLQQEWRDDLEKAGPYFDVFFRNRKQNAHAYDAARNILIEKLDGILSEPLRRALNLWIGRFDYTYSFYELACLIDRLKDHGLHLFGGSHWKAFFAERFGECRRLSDRELLALYVASDINLCLTKRQFKSLVHDRLYAILALGGFVLTDYRESLHEAFGTDAVAMYRDEDDAAQLAEEWLNRPADREAFAKRGHLIVSQRHTYAHRADELLRLVQKRFGLS